MVEFTLAGEKGNVRRQVSLRPGHNRIEAEIPIPNPKLWTPATPSLYTLQSRLSVGDGKTDQVTERFGMREFTVRDGNYNLNGKKILIKASFWEGFYPNTLAFPPNRDIVRREVLLAKEAGFNVLRLWRKPPVPMILDVADEMGIMIIDAPPIECMDFWPQLAPETEHRIAIEVSELVHRDRNHPSVICWEVFNEVARSGIARLKQTMSLLARDTDPTRIVVDESGGWAGGAHAYLPYSYESQPINEIHSYRPSPVDPQTYQSYLGLGRPGFDTSSLAQSRSKMRAPDGIIFISEVGYGGLPDLPANVAQYQREGNPLTPDYRSHVSLLAGIGKAMSEMKWSEIFPDVSALCRASQRVQAEGNRLQLEALRLNPRINGYCVHAFTDGDWVLGAGLLDQFRNPKLTYESIKKVQTPLYVAVRVNPSNVREGEKGTLLIDSVNDRAPARGRIEWEIVGPGDRVLLHDSKTVTIGAGVTNLLEAPLPALAVSGTHIARVRFVPESGAPFENQRDFFYLAKKDLAAPDVAFALDDPKHEITPFLEARGIRYRQFSGNESDLPPVVVATDAPKDGAALLAYIARGGVAVFLKPPAIPFEASGSAATKPANKWLGDGGFPLKLWYAAARGNWVPVNHGIRKHPIFDGLPSSDFMGQVYLNVCANQTLVGANVPPIVGSLSIKIDNHSIDRNYLGLNEVWWGADLAAVPHGKGQMLLSTLRLKENLKTDPVAEKLLYNMIRWASSVAGR